MNAVVFVLQGCPVGPLGPYGNEWVGTPHLDRLAAAGVVFDRHLSDCPDPAAARRAWATGRHQFPNAAAEPPPVPSLTLPVRRVLVRACRPENDPTLGGWDEVVDARPDPADARPLDALIRALPDVLDRLAGEPRWLLWVEIDRLMPPWDVPQDVFEAYVSAGDEGESGGPSAADEPDDDEPDDDEPDEEGADDEEDEGEEDEDEEESEDDPDAGEPVRPWADPPTGPFDPADLDAWVYLHSSFAAVVTALDAELGAVFDDLRSNPAGDAAAWLVTADHGLPLGEHGQVGRHRPWLHEELVHVPLVVRLPGDAEAGRRVSALTQPADLLPTLRGLLGVDPPAGEGLDGFSLLPLLRGEAASVREFACSGLALNGSTEWAIRTPDAAVLVPTPGPDDPPRRPMLFEKPDDRWEVNDLRQQHLERAEELERVLRGLVQQP